MYSLLLLNIYIYPSYQIMVSLCTSRFMNFFSSVIVCSKERVLFERLVGICVSLRRFFLRNRTLQSKYKYSVINLIRGYAITRNLIERALSVSFLK